MRSLKIKCSFKHFTKGIKTCLPLTYNAALLKLTECRSEHHR
uniref:Uncharacterized protein n=1 Tax=Anguilla anguilla TaxID=7936 RepID=A0A0E9WMV2_ANGAN